MDRPPSDQRRDPRAPLLLRIDYPDAPGFRDVTENLSAGGLFIRTDRPLEPGDRVPLLLSFPGLLEPTEVEVEVAWVRPASGEAPSGVALRLPEGRVAEREKLAALARAAAVPHGPERTWRILLVEDNALLVGLYESAIRKLTSPDGRVGVEVYRAANGTEAMARLKVKPRPDLVVADLYMPVMDGFTLVEQIRSDPEVMMIPILAISAGGGEARRRAIELGVDVYLPKPVRFAEILGTIRALLHIA